MKPYLLSEIVRKGSCSYSDKWKLPLHAILKSAFSSPLPLPTFLSPPPTILCPASSRSTLADADFEMQKKGCHPSLKWSPPKMVIMKLNIQ